MAEAADSSLGVERSEGKWALSSDCTCLCCEKVSVCARVVRVNRVLTGTIRWRYGTRAATALVTSLDPCGFVNDDVRSAMLYYLCLFARIHPASTT
jgi:hypothetical protein